MAQDKLQPLRPTDVQLAEHGYRRHTVTVRPGLGQDDLVNPELWTSASPKITAGDEVRVLSEDFSFVAYLLCTYRVGNQCIMRLVAGYDLDPLGDEVPSTSERYDVVLRGPKKWCVVDKETGEVVKELIATRARAYQELEDLLRALAA